MASIENDARYLIEAKEIRDEAKAKGETAPIADGAAA